MSQDDENYIRNETAENLLCIKSEWIEMKKMDLAPLLPNNDNFTMHASVSNVSIPSVSFI